MYKVSTCQSAVFIKNIYPSHQEEQIKTHRTDPTIPLVE